MSGTGKTQIQETDEDSEGVDGRLRGHTDAVLATRQRLVVKMA